MIFRPFQPAPQRSAEIVRSLSDERFKNCALDVFDVRKLQHRIADLCPNKKNLCVSKQVKLVRFCSASAFCTYRRRWNKLVISAGVHHPAPRCKNCLMGCLVHVGLLIHTKLPNGNWVCSFPGIQRHFFPYELHRHEGFPMHGWTKLVNCRQATFLYLLGTAEVQFMRFSFEVLA